MADNTPDTDELGRTLDPGDDSGIDISLGESAVQRFKDISDSNAFRPTKNSPQAPVDGNEPFKPAVVPEPEPDSDDEPDPTEAPPVTSTPTGDPDEDKSDKSQPWESLDDAQLSQAAELYTYLNSLPEQTRAGIGAFVTGEYTLVHNDDLHKLYNYVEATQQPDYRPPNATTPTPSSTPSDSPDEDWEDLPDSVKRQFLEMKAKLDSLETTQVNDLEQRRFAQTQEQTIAACNTVIDEYKTKLNLTDDEYAQLETATVQSQLPAFYTQQGLPPDQALRKSFDLISAQLDFMKARTLIADESTIAVKSDRRQTRQRKAASMGGAGGNVTGQPQTPTNPSRQRVGINRGYNTANIAAALSEQN